MANTTGQTGANKTGDKNKGNPSMTDDQPTGGNVENDSKPHIEPSETEGKGVNPGRTPGKAEGVDDAEERGNQ